MKILRLTKRQYEELRIAFMQGAECYLQHLDDSAFDFDGNVGFGGQDFFNFDGQLGFRVEVFVDFGRNFGFGGGDFLIFGESSVIMGLLVQDRNPKIERATE